MPSTPPRSPSPRSPSAPGGPPGPQPSEGRPAPVPRGRPRWTARAVTALSVVVLASAGIGHTVLTGLDADIGRVDPFKDMKNRPEGGDGMNVLLVGTDGRDRISPRERRRYRLGGAPCNCTDTMMIVHLSADRRRAGVVSLPRDSYATTPSHTDRTTHEKHPGHPLKLNAAYAEGGPQLTVRLVESMTRVRIDHYLEVDFTSFMKTVDVLGGVEVCTAKPLRDGYTGLDLPVGTHRLMGGRALQYVRARHVDAASDLSRMQRQQRFLAALIDRATSSGILLNPLRFRDVARAVLGSMRADKGFGTDELLTLGRAMWNLSLSSSEFTTVPIARMGYTVEGVGSTLKWDTAKARRLFAALRHDKPLTAHRPAGGAPRVEVPPEQIRVQVENGTGHEGLGRRVDAALAAAGFGTTRARSRTAHPGGPGERTVRRTVIAYDPRWDRSAKTLAAALPGSELRAVRGRGRTLKVTLGSDVQKVRAVRVEHPAPRNTDGTSGAGVVRGDEVVCP
ncbi:LCP family protein [Streptomyces sp. NPDC005925]|uniref:LCP family protein n=1 Tax=Streptomyces sp. NPDC005925 TaxID=3157172 RepID=UPI0033CD4189